MNKLKETPKISNVVVWFSFAIMSISLFLKHLKLYFIIKNIDVDKRVYYLQNFKTTADFENLLEKVNPLEIDNLIDFYHLDYFFMVGYALFLILLIYKVKYSRLNKNNVDKISFHVFHFILAILVLLTLTLDVLENWQLIYQTKNFRSALIESCYYYERYQIKILLVALPIFYILFPSIFLRKS